MRDDWRTVLERALVTPGLPEMLMWAIRQSLTETSPRVPLDESRLACFTRKPVAFVVLRDPAEVHLFDTAEAVLAALAKPEWSARFESLVDSKGAKVVWHSEVVQ